MFVCVCVCALLDTVAGGLQGGEDRGGVPELHKIFRMFLTLLSGVSGPANGRGSKGIKSVCVFGYVCVASTSEMANAQTSKTTGMSHAHLQVTKPRTCIIVIITITSRQILANVKKCRKEPYHF